VDGGETDNAVLKEMVAVGFGVRIKVQTAVSTQFSAFSELSDVLEEVGLTRFDKQGGAEVPLATLLIQSESNEHVNDH
jgi:hypothetical protein